MHHLNLWGSYTTSAYLGQYLQKEYAFSDKRGQTEYTDWEEVAEMCYEKIAKILIEENANDLQ